MLSAAWNEATRPIKGPHSELDLALMKSGGGDDSLDVLFSPLFRTAGRCAGCHGHDPAGVAMVDEDSVDVNVADDWRSTMMGNSARDPFFRAKMEHEVLVNPGHQLAIENKCTGCHAPLGHHEQKILGLAPFDAAMLDTSRIGIDGVSCLACHSISPDSAGLLFSGTQRYDTFQVYGPYPDDEINQAIMEFFVGFKPQYGQHIQDGRVCASCHTLETETIDLGGNLTGDHFFEQATWHEWKNSIYFNDPDKTCRGCHLPRIQDSIILASEYLFLPPHAPFGKHHLAGGNVFMLQLMKEHKEALNIPASTVHFDSTIARTLDNLQQKSIDMDLSLVARTPDTAYIDVSLLNLTGHKFPSGYPSRRAFIELIVRNAAGDTLFKSGRIDGSYEVEGQDPAYEPHYDVITQGDQVQIYEMVMGDVNGDVTTVLERAKDPIKDDRLPPQGFTSTHYAYDTCLVAGVPPGDLDFNLDALGTEGTGADIVHYHVPMANYSGLIQVSARFFFQPVPPKWNQEMFGYSASHIDTFRTMYENADGTPTLVAAGSLSDDRTGLPEADGHGITIWPNPSANGIVNIAGEQVEILGAYDAKGAWVRITTTTTSNGLRVVLPEAAGTYQLRLRLNGREFLQRVIRD
jgi:hypothetical protein